MQPLKGLLHSVVPHHTHRKDSSFASTELLTAVHSNCTGEPMPVVLSHYPSFMQNSSAKDYSKTVHLLKRRPSLCDPV